MSIAVHQFNSNMNGVNGAHIRDTRRQLRDHSAGSPLQIFVRAKKKINDIYQEIEEYVGETAEFIQNIPVDKEVICNDDQKEIEGFVMKVCNIKEVLARDHMKVAFFGRTSNGKSTVINAMLGDKILPSGIGHTTNCFLQVEGDETNEPFLIKEGTNEQQNLGNISSLAHALCNNHMGDSSLVRIHWPKNKCQLLKDDVVLVDSPGIDVSESLDEWIDKHCLDADVFVLVANSESTLMNTEKKFFHKVSTKLSKPNIFVLHNRWDMAANESEFMQEVKDQHMSVATHFLVEELKVVDEIQAQQRIFFVSAKEALNARLCELRGTPVTNVIEGHNARYLEFEDFERKFEECISKSAVVTKFKQHTQKGASMACDIERLVGGVQEKSVVIKDKRIDERKELILQKDYTDNEMNSLTLQIKDRIKYIVEDVERRVSAALNEEIRRLSVLVDEYNEPFHPEPLVLSVYKKQLHTYVETGLGSNLRSRLSSALALNMESSQQDMTRRMINLLPSDKQHLADTLIPRREPFEVLYRLNCENLCQDFQEDVKFRFSFSFVSLIQKLMGRAAGRIVNANHKESIPRNLTPMTPMTPMTPSNEPSSSISQDDWSIISRLAVASIGSQGTMGILLGMGLMFRTIGWRLVAVSVGVYSLLYAYERLTWTTAAKEREFKRQYVDHATRKLRLIVDLTSSNCSHQVQQELTGTFARLCRVVDETMNEMNKELRHLDKEIQFHGEISNRAKKLRNKAHYIINELNNFKQSYLASQRN